MTPPSPDLALTALALKLAAQAHAGQVDKAGAPYLGHAVRVGEAQADPIDRCIGFLHDVVEDCPGWTLARLALAGMPPAVVEAVDALTKREGEDRDRYLARVMANPRALKVKIADMRDNMDLARIAAPTETDRARLAKYRQTLPILEAALAARL